jgi:cellobiose phosphorylase
MINPVNRGGTPQGIATYRVEPYVVAADVYARPPHTGRGGWTWYTGSAGWMYQFIAGSLLGLRIEANKLHFNPRIPPTWSSFKVHYRYRETVYHITILRLQDQGTESRVVLDGVVQAETYLSLIDDRKDHHAELRFHGETGEFPAENPTAENVPLIVQ